MKNKLFIMILSLIFLTAFFRFKVISNLVLALESDNIALNVFAPTEKRGNPAYDTVIDKYGIPHFRVFFWVPKNAKRLIPYADPGIKTKVLTHGPIENWSVVKTNTIKNNEQLVFIYVPKSFVLFYGKGFQNVIHLRYQ
ncbi:MAG: hypothetical protein GX206_01635 [Clostridiales bacterium]|nr:hypothetical protein [Clostridiales bacterium]